MAAEGTQVGSIFYALDLDDAQFLSKVAASKDAAGGLSSSIESAGKNISQAGADLMPFSIAAGAALGIATKAAVGFDQDMELVHTQAGASQQEVDSLKQSVLNLAEATGIGPDQLAEGLYHVESVGYRGATAMNILQIAAQGAQIGQANLNDTAYALTSTLSSQIDGAQNASEAMGSLLAIVGNGDMHFQDLNGAISTGILSTAKTFGLSLNSVGAALDTLTDNGEHADEASTRLRMTMALMASPSSAAAKALGAIGLTSSQAMSSISSFQSALVKAGIKQSKLADDLRQPNGFMVALQDLKKHLEDAGLSADAADAVMSKSFGGGRSDAALLTMLGNLDRMNTKFKALSSSGNAMQSEWASQQDQAKQKLDQFNATIQVVAVELGNTFLPTLEAIAKEIGNVAQWFSRLSPSTLKIIANVLLVIAALGPLLMIIGNVIKTVGHLVTAIDFVVSSLELLGLAISILALTVGLPVEVVAAIIVAIVAVIVAAAYFLITHWKQVIKFFESIPEFFQDVGKNISKAFNNSLKNVERFFNDLWSGIGKAFNTGLSNIRNFLGDIGQLFRNIWDLFTGGDPTTFWHHEYPWTDFMVQAENLRYTILGFIGAIPGDIAKWWNELIAGGIHAWDAFIGIFAWKNILKGLYDIGYGFGFLIRVLIGFATQTVPNFISSVVKWFQKLPGEIGKILSDMWKSTTAWFTRTRDDATTTAEDTVNNVGDWFAKLPGRIGSLLASVWNTTTTWFTKTWQDTVASVGKWLSSMWTSMINWFNKMWTDTVKIVSDMISGIIKFFSDLPGNLLSFIKSVGDASTKVGQAILNGIMSVVTGIPKLVGDIFKNIAGAIGDTAKNVGKSAQDMAGSIWNGFKNGLGIHSPSYIERAFEAISVQGQKTVNDLQGHIGKLNAIGNRATQLGLYPSYNVQTPLHAVSPTQVNINLSGIMTTNQSGLRSVAQQLTDAMNQSLRAKNIPQIGVK